MPKHVLFVCCVWVWVFTVAAIVFGGDAVAAIATQIVMSLALVWIWWFAGREP